MGLYAMRAFSDVPMAALDLAAGVILDVLVIGGLFARMRARAILKNAFAAGVESPVMRGFAWVLLIEVCVVAFVAVVLRIGDTVTCYFALSHVTEAIWHHISPGSLGYVSDPRVVAVLAAMAAAAAILVWLSRGPKTKEQPSADYRGPFWQVIAVAAVCWLVPALWPFVQPQHPHHWAIVPEINALYTLAGSLADDGKPADPASVTIPKLSEEDVAVMRRAGIIAPNAKPNGPWPVRRTGFGAVDALPRRATATVANLAPIAEAAGRNTGKRPPNVLLIHVESLNVGFTGLHAASKNAGVMPRLERSAESMTHVRGFHNIASPTANGLIASMCSTVPAAAVQDIDVGGTVDGGAAYRCIADVLRDAGYATYFARGASKVYMGAEAILRGHGFDAVTGREDLKHLFPNRPTNSWGYFDRTLADFMLTEFDRLRDVQKPWFYALLTVDSHLPGFVDPACEPPAEIAGERVLSGFYCTDLAVDRILAGLRAKGLWDSTLVVITGDHAQLPTRKIQRLIGNDALFGAFAQMPLLIHDPLHALPATVDVLSSQLDLAPTMLHLLGLDTAKLDNSFLGYSVFGDRRRFAFLVGRTGRRSAYVQSAKSRRTIPLGTLPQLCEDKARLLSDGSFPLDACQLERWYAWLDAIWAGHRLYPADRYTGGTGTDAQLLRLKWLRYDQKEERQRRKNGVTERKQQH